MAIKRTVLVFEYEDTQNGYDTAGDIANVVHGCVEDMEGSSFLELSITAYGTMETLIEDFNNDTGAFLTEAEMLPIEVENVGLKNK